MRHRDIIDVHQPAKPFFDALAADIVAIKDGYLRHGRFDEYAAYQREIISILRDMAPDGMWKDWRAAVSFQLKNPAGATAWKARALNLNEADPHMSIALANMAAMKVNGEWMLAIPMPLPCPVGPKYDEPEEIVLIHPQTGAARLYSDDVPSLVEPIYTDRFTVHADARVWAREIASHAVEWLYHCESARRIANIRPDWNGYPSSALAIGDIGKIIWPQINTITVGAGVDAAQLKKIIFRQARITHVEAPLQMARAA